MKHTTRLIATIAVLLSILCLLQLFAKVYSQTIAAGMGGEHSLAVCDNGNVRAWGYNSSGQIGDNSISNKISPVLVLKGNSSCTTYLCNITDVAGGTFHSLALMNDGTVWAWGSNGNGRLGDGTTTARYTPVKVVAGTSGCTTYLCNIRGIAAGDGHSIALKSDGTVWAWGLNAYGQLGDNTTTDKTIPVQVQGLTNVIAIASGWHHSLALKNDGTVWTWGRNLYGGLGNNTWTNSSVPVQVHGPNDVGFLTGIITVNAGKYFSLAIKNDSTLWSWGENGCGQLGNNDPDFWSQNTPVQVHGLNDVGFLTSVKAVAGGQNHTIALKSDGTVWGWGCNGNAPLGDGGGTWPLTPIQMWTGNSGCTTYICNIAAIATGTQHSIMLKNDGLVYGCGVNWSGQLGDNSTTNRSTPVQAVTSCPISLPIELLTFTARWQDEKRNTAVAEWTTVAEINNNYFTVERSTDALHFDSIGTVKGAGNSKVSLNYSFLDNNLQPLIAQNKHLFYYRLKQTDFDGKYTHSNIVVLGLEKNFELVNLYPVPANQDVVSYMVLSREKQTVKTEVIDFLGQKVISKTDNLQEGANTLYLNISALSNAVYYMRITTGSGKESEGKRLVLK